jgi:hypothetical protein
MNDFSFINLLNELTSELGNFRNYLRVCCIFHSYGHFRTVDGLNVMRHFSMQLIHVVIGERILISVCCSPANNFSPCVCVCVALSFQSWDIAALPYMSKTLDLYSMIPRICGVPLVSP